MVYYQILLTIQDQALLFGNRTEALQSLYYSSRSGFASISFEKKVIESKNL